MHKENTYDLEERTTVLAENIVIFIEKVPISRKTLPLTNQLIRSATSIGANYSEALGSSSRKDFRNKIALCKKESFETKYWLRLLLRVCPAMTEEIQPLLQETSELTYIFSRILYTLNQNNN